MMNGPEIDLHNYQRIVFFTGAGVSAESGISTYRGKGGTWNFYDYEEVACQRAFDRDPEKVWDFHEQRRADLMTCEPNHAHVAMAAIEKAKPETVVVTQNIDGLHQRAGSRNVIELHGSLWRLRAPDGSVIENHDVPLRSRVGDDGRYWRPDVTWFEDPLDMATIERAVRALERCDCVISIGTSGLVYPAADLPRIATSVGALSVEVNPEPTPQSGLYDVRLRGAATEMMSELWS